MEPKEDVFKTTYRNYLEGLIPKEVDINKKYLALFKKEARFMGSKWYRWGDLESNCVRILFLKGCLIREGIKFRDEY